MAGATTVLTAASAAVGLGKGISDISRGSRIEERAQEELDNYQRQDLGNVYTGMAVPTRGTSMQRRETQRTQAETAYLAGQSGAQGAIGAAPRIASSTQQSMAKIGAQIEESEFKLQGLVAEDEARIRQMQERREQQDIAGLGAEVAYGRSVRDAGMGQLASGLGSAAEVSMGTAFGERDLWGNGGGEAGGSTKPPTMSPMSSQPAGSVGGDPNVDTTQLRGTNQAPSRNWGSPLPQNRWQDRIRNY